MCEHAFENHTLVRYSASPKCGIISAVFASTTLERGIDKDSKRLAFLALAAESHLAIRNRDGIVRDSIHDLVFRTIAFSLQ